MAVYLPPEQAAHEWADPFWLMRWVFHGVTFAASEALVKTPASK